MIAEATTEAGAGGHALPPGRPADPGPCQLCRAVRGHRLGCAACACEVAICQLARERHHHPDEEDSDG